MNIKKFEDWNSDKEARSINELEGEIKRIKQGAWHYRGFKIVKNGNYYDVLNKHDVRDYTGTSPGDASDWVDAAHSGPRDGTFTDNPDWY